MCGIAGLLGAPPDVARAALPRMLDRLAHRGPDDRSIVASGDAVLGFARLAIIDLSPAGRQPMTNEDGTVVSVVNGEIYNYIELRRELVTAGHTFRGGSDAEVIPHLYEQHGDGFVDRLRGMFAIGLWDARRMRLLLVRDRLGKKPLFYCPLRNGGLAFASEMKALWASPGGDFDTRPEGILDYLTHGVVPGPATVYRGIRRVRPAHLVHVEREQPARERPYWRLGFHAKRRISRAAALEEVQHRLRDAVTLRLRSDVPVGCFLSGGIDSSLVAALASRQQGAPLRTFSIGFDEPAWDERRCAAQVAERIGAVHTAHLLRPMSPDRIARCVEQYDEPFFDPAVLPNFALAELAGGVKVVLTGDGGDEVFSGYPHVAAARALARLRRLGVERSGPLLRAALAVLPRLQRGRTPYQAAHRFLRMLAEPADRRYLILTNDLLTLREVQWLWPDAAALENRRERTWERAAEHARRLGPVDEMLALDIQLRLADNHLVRMDTATMARGLEARSPLLDHELLEFVAGLPERVRLSGSRSKPLLRDLALRWLPADVARRPKRGFGIPLTAWLNQDLGAWARERLLDRDGYAWNHFNRRRLETLLDRRGLDTRDRWRWAKVIWALVCLEIWWTHYRALRVAP